MSENALFSQYYSTNIDLHKDKIKFRNRILRLLERMVNENCKDEVYSLCQTRMGIDLKKHMLNGEIDVISTFEDANIPVENILDFLSIVYDAILWRKETNPSYQALAEILIECVNKIFKEESMCYVMHDNGRIRYCIDEKFQELVKSTLIILTDKKFALNLVQFNKMLDVLYEKRNTEISIIELVRCIETLCLNMIRDRKFKLLNESLIDSLINKIKDKVRMLNVYEDYDLEALDFTRKSFSAWLSACHKYRHSKEEQAHINVPLELFNYIVSAGISIYRFLLELESKFGQ